jgi:hypothetical protein
VSELEVPVTVTVAVPTVADAEAVKVKVEVALPLAGGVTGFVENAAVTPVGLTVTASGGGAQTAVYDSTLKAPKCATVGSSCDSGPTLLLGKDTMSGGAEPNQPNTINNSCADGTSETFTPMSPTTALWCHPPAAR